MEKGKLSPIRLRNETDTGPLLPSLFLSDIEGANDERELRIHHIDLIISLLSPDDDVFHADGIEYVRFSIHDGEGDIVSIARQIAKIIDETDRTKHILIHCIAGQSRSASAVIYYVMHRLHIPYKEAKRMVKASRPIIRPSSHYAKQMKAVENEII